MKKILFVLIALISFGLASEAQTATKNLKKIPTIDIKDVDGNPFNTSKIANDGKPIIISFWATWCKPCIKELTTISEVYDEWVEETGVKIYAVSIDDARSTNQVRPLANGKNWEYVVLLDPNGDFKRAMSVGPIPQTFLINGNGEIVWTHTSFSEGGELDLIKHVRQVIANEEIK